MNPKNISPDGLAKQDKVNNADSVFIFLIIFSISRIGQSGLVARIVRMNKG